MRIEPLTCAIGAQVHDVSLGDAVRDDGLFQAIHAALLQHKVLFLRDQTLDKLSRLDHIELAGEPQLTATTFVGGLKHLPIRYTLR